MSIDVSVVIPVLNEKEYIPLLLEDLLKQSRPPAEVIISDCGSSDGTIELLKANFGWVRVVSSSAKRPSVARHAGAAAATSNTLVFIDADIRIPRDFIEQLYKCQETSGSDIAYPVFKSDGKSIMGALHIFIIRIWLAFYRNIFTEKGIGAVIMVGKQAFNALGGFDSSLAKAEDVAFYERAHKTKLKIFFCKKTSCRVSSRRTAGFGFVRTIFEDLKIFSNTRSSDSRSYDRYK